MIVENETVEVETKEKKKSEISKLVGTLFRNALRSNLDLTSLADTKAGILISINGFILTVSVTASGFAIHSTMMTYAFISIILTSLGSIIFAVLAVKPRGKKAIVKKEFLDGYESLLYYQDMADLSPNEYDKKMKKVLKNTKSSKEEMITHLHILGAEIKKKYFWLKQAYTYFSLGLIISATLIIYALVNVEQTPFYNISKGNVVYSENEFYNVFEPSGATTMPDGKVLIVEDESSAHALKLLEPQENGKIVEIGNLYMDKKIKKRFKKDIEDLEAITSDGNLVYGITSHTIDKNGKRLKSREQFIMFSYVDGAIEDLYMYSKLKKELHKAFPDLFHKTLFSNSDINIEGLCFDEKSKSVLLGFRAPQHDDKALIIGIKNPRELFVKKEKPIFSEPMTIDLNGMGIRDITYDEQKEGYWVIAGSSSVRDGDFKLWFWDREHNITSIVKNQPDIGYGEGVTLINKKSKRPDLLIVEDNGKAPNKSANYIIIDRNSL